MSVCELSQVSVSDQAPAHAMHRFDPVRNAERVAAVSSAPLSGRREKMVIAKENNFMQVGA